MPTYILINQKTGDQQEVFCSYRELEEMLIENPDLKQKLNTPGFIPQGTSTLRKAGEGWRDMLGRIKKNAGRGNTINDWRARKILWMDVMEIKKRKGKGNGV